MIAFVNGIHLDEHQNAHTHTHTHIICFTSETHTRFTMSIPKIMKYYQHYRAYYLTFQCYNLRYHAIHSINTILIIFCTHYSLTSFSQFIIFVCLLTCKVRIANILIKSLLVQIKVWKYNSWKSYVVLPVNSNQLCMNSFRIRETKTKIYIDTRL